MKQIKMPIGKIKCDVSKYNKIEVNTWKRLFLEKIPMPSPWINRKNEVIAFYTSFFVDKELNHKNIYVVKEK